MEKVIAVKYAPYVTFHEIFDTLAKGMCNRVFILFIYFFSPEPTRYIFLSFVLDQGRLPFTDGIFRPLACMGE